MQFSWLWCRRLSSDFCCCFLIFFIGNIIFLLTLSLTKRCLIHSFSLLVSNETESMQRLRQKLRADNQSCSTPCRAGSRHEKKYLGTFFFCSNKCYFSFGKLNDKTLPFAIGSTFVDDTFTALARYWWFQNATVLELTKWCIDAHGKADKCQRLGFHDWFLFVYCKIKCGKVNLMCTELKKNVFSRVNV